jgi:hypothetical protein
MSAEDRYTKLPVTIDAKQYTGGYENALEICHWADDILKARGERGRVSWSYSEDLYKGTRFYIDTLEGSMEVVLGDYVIIGIEGEAYPCKPQIFQATYRQGEARNTITAWWESRWLALAAGFSAGAIVLDVIWRSTNG